jgi:hypothetical protein
LHINAADVLSVIREGDERIHSQVFGDMFTDIVLLIGHPVSTSPTAFTSNNRNQRVRIAIAIVKYYGTNHNRIRKTKSELLAILRAVRRLPDFEPEAVVGSDIVEALASRYYSLLKRYREESITQGIQRFNRYLSGYSEFRLEERKPGEPVLMPPVVVPY